MKRRITMIVAVLTIALAGVACDSGGGAAGEEARIAADQLERFLQTQPVPVFEWSQLRQNLIELSTAQARTTQTTTFFFNMGIQNPVASCASIGFPIAATYQLTSPESLKWFGNGPGHRVVPQLEATGVYTANTTGTYAMCTDPNGAAYAQYWEGFVMTVTGPAVWQDGQVVLTGDPTFDFSIGQDG